MTARADRAPAHADRLADLRREGDEDADDVPDRHADQDDAEIAQRSGAAGK